jgi:hypothetical protein
VRRVAAAAALALLLVSTSAQASATDDVGAIDRGLARAAEDGRIFFEDAAAYRAIATRAADVARRLPPDREANLRAVLHEVAAYQSSYDSPRATALFAMLATNTSYFGTHGVPPAKTDVTDADGVVYRYFPGLGLQWHPLASFGALNAVVTARDATRSARLAEALVEREEDGGYEYYFAFAGGRGPWLSGLAQAVAAQALARAGELTSNSELAVSAAHAYGVAARLVLRLPSGPWIRLYSFDREIVLNAELQSILSLEDYAALTGDGNAQTLGDALALTAKKLLPSFDTGAWSLYSLGGAEATLDYETYVTQLLRKLAARDAAWSDAASRFAAYLKQAPTLSIMRQSQATWPVPRDGYRDLADVTFTLSKISRVVFTVGARHAIATVSRGTHTFAIDPAALLPGVYDARLAVTDLAGNIASTPLGPVSVEHDTTAPQMFALLEGTTLTWSSDDGGTPWLRLQVVLRRDGLEKVRDLGRRELEGTYTLAPPVGTWEATLRATNSAGRTATVPLGPFPAPG